MLGKIVVGIAWLIAAVIGAVIAAYFVGTATILLIEWVTGYDAVGEFDGDKGEIGEHLTILAYGLAGGAAAWVAHAVFVIAERKPDEWRNARRARQRRAEWLERENRELRRELDERRP